MTAAPYCKENIYKNGIYNKYAIDYTQQFRYEISIAIRFTGKLNAIGQNGLPRNAHMA